MDCAKDDDSICLVVGDVGYSFVEPFERAFPSRFLNAGIAEQNMVSLSAGIALSGGKVFCYSLANFSTLRCLEQIRNDVCYHNLHVVIVSSGGGLGYGNLGITHHTTEDIAVMRALPNMTVVAPGDGIEAMLATRALARWPHPSYLRISKATKVKVYGSQPDFEIGKAIVVRQGTDVAVVSTGGILETAVMTAESLLKRGVSCEVVSMHTVKPIDSNMIRSLASRFDIIATIEEHGLIGGLGSAVSEVLAEDGSRKTTLLKFGIERPFASIVGGYEYLKRYHGLTSEHISKRIIEANEKRIST